MFRFTGTYWSSHVSYKFRFNSEDFELIGADYNSFNRATHDYIDYSFNLINGKYSLKKGNDGDEVEAKVEWSVLKDRSLKSIAFFSGLFKWEVVEGVFL